MAFSPDKATSKDLFWAFPALSPTKLLYFVAVIIIARYVDSADLGLMAICLAIIGYSEIMSSIGLGSALVSAQDRHQETGHARIFCALLAASLMAILLWLGAVPTARLFDSPEIQQLLGAICVILVIQAIGSAHDSARKFRKKLLPDVAQGLVRGLTPIILAIAGFGTRSLVASYLAGARVATLMLFWIRPWKPSALPDRPRGRFAMGCGSCSTGAETISATPRLVDKFLVGTFLGPAARGTYALAFRIPEFAIERVVTFAGTVLHPVTLKMQTQSEDLTKYADQSLRSFALPMLGIGAGHRSTLKRRHA
ncbi:oligosaccharide flippase family protein [Salipiger mangrovisoli]|uniref:Oligosaccharide flippase family protein n=1 Tax=Salipiger mangrovisoli TaxID=2865933 RepID=A0ABR9WZE5_9RHOB|nr:oligosaccharide flippase family protein [Salipiger mangrovisoli]MBE9636662.1 oligosaccharide flippase family protein [Salipiger mangrovisoli]